MHIKKIVSTFFFAAVLAIAAPIASHAGGHGKDIVHVAIKDGNFKTLVTAIKPLVWKNPDGRWTIHRLRPDDEAFAKLPAGTVEDLLKPENKDKLVAVLTYHVIPGKVMSADIAGKKLDAKTVQGSELMIDATDGVKVDNATVIKADVMGSNGVIHVIDSVVLPK